MTVLLIVVAFLAGCLTGLIVAVRVTPRLIARLPKAEQLAFARKVNRHRKPTVVAVEGRTSQ